ncbi:MAG: hypothetical protein O2928_11540 [Proteobacteria bacterium]|uniref:hypothetical protein n=1 Tax=Acinetobacter venetianus TaxID=52133 RepID=UPI00215038E5|nr:hypothetical protein [Acinetobacter venetianus]MDA1255109.1 hypothetical protein [Pseudomonadota bacterium]
MIAKDLFFRNFIEFRGEIIQCFLSEQYNYTAEIQIVSQEKIHQDLSDNFLILTPNETKKHLYQRLRTHQRQVQKFSLDDFIEQPVIFRSFQHSAFIFDLGITLTDQLAREVTFFFYHLEYFNQQGKKQTLKYKRIEQVKHHINFKDRSHIIKLIFHKTEFTFICDKIQFKRLRQFLYSSDISFL